MRIKPKLFLMSTAVLIAIVLGFIYKAIALQGYDSWPRQPGSVECVGQPGGRVRMNRSPDGEWLLFEIDGRPKSMEVYAVSPSLRTVSLVQSTDYQDLFGSFYVARPSKEHFPFSWRVELNSDFELDPKLKVTATSASDPMGSRLRISFETILSEKVSADLPLDGIRVH